MRIALISPPKEFKKFEENIRITSEEFGKQPPLSLAYIAALVREHGHRAIIIDAANIKLSKEEVLKNLKDFRADAIGVGIHSIYYIRPCINLLEYLKTNLDIPVIAGGVGFNLYPDEIMTYKVIDFGLAGSIVHSFPKLLDALGDKKDYRKIDGVYYHDRGRLIKNKPKKLRDELDSLPFPARDLLKNEIYWQFITQRKNFTNMLTSTGCSFNCTFCNERAGKFEQRKIEKVIEEMRECYYKYGIREIDFFDRTFTIDRKRTLELCKEMIKSNLDIKWSCRSRIDTVDAEMLRIMKRAGCFAIFYGIESADENVLRNVDKRISLKKVRETIRITNTVGIKTLGFFMFGNPGETEESIKKTIDFALSLGLSYATFTKTIAKPKSLYDEMNIKKTGSDYWRGYILGNCIELPAIRTWTSLDDRILNRYIRNAFFRFYFRPRYALNAVKDAKSLEELLRYTRSSIKFLLFR